MLLRLQSLVLQHGLVVRVTLETKGRYCQMQCSILAQADSKYALVYGLRFTLVILC